MNFVVVLWDHLVCDGLLVLFAENLLQDDDQGQDQSDLAEQQSLTGDQGNLTDGEWKDGGHFDLEEGQQMQEHVLALLLCKNTRKRIEYNSIEYAGDENIIRRDLDILGYGISWYKR